VKSDPVPAEAEVSLVL